MKSWTRAIGPVGLLATLLAVTAPLRVPHAVADASLRTRVDAILLHMQRRDSFSGTVLIAQKGRTIVDRGYGLANRARNIADGRSSQYRIFDITEQFTAMAILELQERGKLRVAARACSYISGCPASWRPITIQDLLTHESGIPSFTAFAGYHLDERESPRQIAAAAMRRKLLFAPGNGFAFSQTEYIVLGLIVEKAAGERYAAFMRQNVFAPLGMVHTGLLRDGLDVRGLARGYDGAQTAPRVDASTPWSDAGLYTTASDLYAWDRALEADRLVSSTSTQAMFTPYVAVPPETQIGYGYGWLIGPLFNHEADFHEGNAGGFAALNMLFPKDGLTIIILSNQGFTDTGAMYARLAPVLLGAQP